MKTQEEMRIYHREYARKRRQNDEYKKYQKDYQHKHYVENCSRYKQYQEEYYKNNKELIIPKQIAANRKRGVLIKQEILNDQTC